MTFSPALSPRSLVNCTLTAGQGEFKGKRTMSTELMQLLKSHRACDDAVKWCKQFKTPAAAWKACQKPEWMLWALDALGIKDDQKSRLFACWCVRQVWNLLTDERSKKAVEVAELFVAGKATIQELDAARAAASAAAWAAARAAGDAAGDAARAAAGAAERAAAWAAWAAWAAARAAAGAAGAAQCKQIRKIWGNPFKKTQRRAER